MARHSGGAGLERRAGPEGRHGACLDAQGAAAWTSWQSKQHLTGRGAVEDFANNRQMNRFTWYRATDWSKPYPGDSKVLTPNEVPLS